MQPERALGSSAGAEGPMDEAAAVHEMATLASDAVTIAAAADCEQPTPPQQMPVARLKKQLLVSGGITTAAKRRQRRLETELAAARNILIAELREEFAERAKVLREEVKRVIAELREVKDLRHERRRRRYAQVAAELVRKEERQRREQAAADAAAGRKHTVEITATPMTPQALEEPAEVKTAAELLQIERQYEQAVPNQLKE
ncbi:unnamed protein product [Phytophthora fragariaefolia]|uniref:Unnamed protein product n=1 Tax=Phytophthora fragariaefolia TaxID=1490495 RepID=A0A9W6TLQ2_9STRA|nr:unnamed protein product [Phytophthora fragariaefolia]